MTSPRLHWTTDSPSGMHRCRFQHLYVLILKCALALAIYIFVGIILMPHTAKRIYTHKGTDKSSWTRRGLNSRRPNWGNSASCQLTSTYASRHWNCVKKRNSNDKPEAALDKWQPVWNVQVSILTHVCSNFKLRPGAGDIHICWYNSDAPTQGNEYKPTKEPINYPEPCEDRTHDLQTETAPPAASWLERTFHATEIV